MSHLDYLAGFLVTVALIELTPGPNMAFLAVVCGRWGAGAGLVTVAGITAGLATYLCASLIGLAEVVARWPWLVEVLRWAGVAYLLWLAQAHWRESAPQAVAPGLRGSLFRRGLLTNLLSPKTALFYVVLLPGFIRPGAGSFVSQGLALGAIHLLVSIIAHVGIVLGAARLLHATSAAPSLARIRTLQRGSALALVLVAGWLAWSTR